MTLEACCLCPVYSIICFGGSHCRKFCFIQIGCWKWQQGFKYCGCDLRVPCHDFNQEHRQSCCFKCSFKAAVICNPQQLIFFLQRHARFFWFVDKWVMDAFILNQFVGLLWLESSTQTVLKAMTGDCASTGRIKVQDHPKFMLMYI